MGSRVKYKRSKRQYWKSAEYKAGNNLGTQQNKRQETIKEISRIQGRKTSLDVGRIQGRKTCWLSLSRGRFSWEVSRVQGRKQVWKSAEYKADKKVEKSAEYKTEETSRGFSRIQTEKKFSGEMSTKQGRKKGQTTC